MAEHGREGRGPGSSRHPISRHTSSSTPACRAARPAGAHPGSRAFADGMLRHRDPPKTPSVSQIRTDHCHGGETAPAVGEKTPDLSRSCPAPPPLLASPCPSEWCPRASTPGARPIAKLSLWFVTVGLSCVRWSRVGKRRVYSRRAVRGTAGSGRQAQRPPLK